MAVVTTRSLGDRRSFLWLAAALLTACGDGATGLPALYGTWEWTGTGGGVAGETREPRPDDPRITVRFSPNGTAVFRRDGEVAREQRFRLVTEVTIFGASPKVVLYFDDEETGRVVEINEAGTKLTLSDNVYDGFSLHYRRSEE